MAVGLQRALSSLQICQRAAVLVGTSPPIDVEGGTRTEEIVARNSYEDLVSSEIANRNWKFCDTELVLARDATAPLTRFDARYVIPADALVMNVNTVLIDGSQVNYDILEGYVHCDATEDAEVVLLYQKRVDEAYWPPAFTMLMIYRMAAIYGASIAGKVEIGSLYGKMAQEQSMIGSNRDAQQATTRKVSLNRYKRIRR